MSLTAPAVRPALATGRSLLLIAVALVAIGWAARATWQDGWPLGAALAAALPTVIVLVPLHLFQLLLSALAWRLLFGPPEQGVGPPGVGPKPSAATFYRLRIMREGIDSLLPVAQVGGEVVAAGRLARRGIDAAHAAASLVVDLTVEVSAQLVALTIGLAALAAAYGGAGSFLGLTGLAAAACIGFALAQRHGGLRLVEALLARIAGHIPGLGGANLGGLHERALALYRRRGAVLAAGALQLAAWLAGTLESWLVLQALGTGADPLQCLVVESIGMAARSAGFAVPGALGVQEGGFMLAALAAGVPAEAALVLSLVKRVRELLVGALGLGLWRWDA